MSKSSGSVSRYVRKSANGSTSETWQYRGRYSDGRSFRKTGFKTKAMAKVALDKYLTELRDGTRKPPEALTLGDWWAEWLQSLEGTHRQTTLSGYTETWKSRLGPLLGHVRLQVLDERHIRDAYAELVRKGYSTATIMGAHRRLRACIRAAWREGHIQRCVIDNVKPPKGKPSKEMRTWTFEQTQKFLEGIHGERDAAMWFFWLATGLRRGELCGLQWDRLDLHNKIVFIDHQRTKASDGTIIEGDVKTTNGVRRIPISAEVCSALQRWKAAQAADKLRSGNWQGANYVFTTGRQTPYAPHSLNQRLDALCKRVGVQRLSPHQLRHTFATRARESGLEVKMLSTLLGHSNISTTYDLYVHPDVEEARRDTDALTRRMFSSGE